VSDSCKTCKYYRTPHSFYSVMQHAGDCRALPPITLKAIGNGDEYPKAVWPPVAESDWCGQYKPTKSESADD